MFSDSRSEQHINTKKTNNSELLKNKKAFQRRFKEAEYAVIHGRLHDFFPLPGLSLSQCRWRCLSFCLCLQRSHPESALGKHHYHLIIIQTVTPAGIRTHEGIII